MKMNFIPFLLGIVFTINSVKAAESSLQSPHKPRPRLWNQLILWSGIGDPTINDLQQLKVLIKAAYNTNQEATVASVENYINNNSVSGWTPSLKNALASYDSAHARFTSALTLWESAWRETKDFKDGDEGKRVADAVLANWTRLLASLGRHDKLEEVFTETKGRILDRGPLSQKVIRTKEAYKQMTYQPGVSYRCGTLAMMNVCHVLYGTNFDFKGLAKLQSSTNGFTLNELAGFSKRLNLGLIPVKRSTSASLIVPSVINWKEHHYGAITAFKNGLYKVADPTMERPRYLKADEIETQASGYFLIPSQMLDSNSVLVAENEAVTVYGKGDPNFMNDGDDQPCTNCNACPVGPGPKPAGNNAMGSTSCGSCRGSSAGPQGMPTWSVSEPYIHLWLSDEPLGYQPAFGPRVSFMMYYRSSSDNTMPPLTLGSTWTCEWLQPVGYSPIDYQPLLYLPGNGIFGFENSTNPTTNYYNNEVIEETTNADGSIQSYVLSFPNGCKNIFSVNPTNYTYDYVDSGYFYLSETIDPQGNALHFYYMPDNTNTPYQTVLKYIVDATGLTNTLNWTDGGDDILTNVTDCYGRSTTLKYDASLNITNITDVGGISSSIAYDDGGFATNLVTLYGTNIFQSLLNDFSGTIARAISVTEPTGAQHLFYFAEAAGWISYPSALIPTNTPLGTLSTDDTGSFDSFYWGPRQYPLLSYAFTNTMDFGALTTNDLVRARIRNWLAGVIWYGDGTHSLDSIDTLSLQEDPSPDGTSLGQLTWFDYPGKIGPDWQGNQILPAVTARVMPDGSTSWLWQQRDGWGHVTNQVAEWWENGAPRFKTNTFVYSTNGFDILSVIGPDGVTQASYGYNTNHQVLFFTNAVGDITSKTYNTNGQLTSVTEPTGLLRTNLYGSDNFLAQAIALGFYTNSYTYSNGLVFTQTDPLGMTVTNAWDNLQRLVGVIYPDTTSNTYTYDALDIVQAVDRMGYTNLFGYNGIRQRIAATNALGYYTLYNYCSCGALDSIQDAAGYTTYFYYDAAGHMTNKVYADGYSVTNDYDLLGQITNVTDVAGRSTAYYFNNHGLVEEVSDAIGLVQGALYDINDRKTNSVDRNGVVITNNYDNLGRMLTRGYPDGGIEHFGYSPAGMIAYTNQLTKKTYYAYDAVRRKVAETNANSQVTQYAYDAASDLTALTDQKGNITEWGYDMYGRVTYKVDATSTTNLMYGYDADNRLTNRWMMGTNTSYGYDSIGNLTNVTYHTSHALAFSYNAMNWMTSMTDGIGTTTFTYTPTGQLQSETGPWANDTISYTYSDQLRTGLDLQQTDTSDWMQSYAYDAAKRTTEIISPAGTFTYTYNPGLAETTSSSLVANIALPNGAFITNTYDNNARMLSTYLYNSNGTALDSSVYTYNVGNQRTSVERSGENTADYTYDPIGQVIADQAYEVSGYAARLNEQLHYGFDPAGNLAYRTNNALIENFQVNSLNELTANTNGGTLTVVGTTTSAATNVTVNGTNASFYGDATFAATNMPLTTTYIAIAQDSYGQAATNSVTVSLSTNITFQYDANGNLTSDGLRCFAYDDENQLIQVWVTNQWQSKFSYDGKMRRRIRQEYTWSSAIGNWSLTNEVRYVYDGNLVIQERDNNNLPTATYTRGKDLSGSLEGAGGIGGLLARTDYSLLATLHCFYHADGNGNITMLISADQNAIAKYLYDAFGNVLSKSGLLADANPYQFSSKEAHLNSGLVCYLYRYYDPNSQRWLNTDPLGRGGFLPLNSRVPTKEEPPYTFVLNDPISNRDPYGLFCAGICVCILSKLPEATPIPQDPACCGKPGYIVFCGYNCYPIITIGPCGCGGSTGWITHVCGSQPPATKDVCPLLFFRWGYCIIDCGD